MISIQTAENIYPAIEELIGLLQMHPTSKLSAILDHRMHKVAWTVGHELLEELRNVLTKARSNETFESDILAQIDRLILVINKELK